MHSRFLRGVGISLTVLFALFFAFMPYAPTHASNERIITVYHDGIEQTVVTDAPTVGGVLQRAEIAVGPSDLVEPATSTQLTAPSYNINVYRARPVTVVDESQRFTVITPHTSAVKIAEAAKLTLYSEDVTKLDRIDNFLADDGFGLKLTIDRSTPLTMVLYGKQQSIRTQAATVGDLIKEKGIVLGEQDGTNVALNTKVAQDMKLEVWRNGAQTITVEEEVPYNTEFIRNTDLPVGHKEVQKGGEKGKKLVTYEIELINGQEVSRNQIQSIMTVQPKTQVEIVGGGSKFSSNAELLYALRICEASGNYQRNSDNGFYGAYQFMVSTWNRVAPKVGRPDLVGVRPDQASPADQDFMVIANANLSGGGFASQHPGCYKKLGLPVKPF